MLLNLALYLYILFFSYTYGLILWKVIKKSAFVNEDAAIPDFFELVFSGLSILILILGYYSIFFKIGMIIHILLLLVAIVFCVFNIKYYQSFLLTIKRIRIHPLVLIPGVLYLAILLVCSSSNILWYSYDTGLYHAKFVQWITDFKAIPGLGNLDGRLAFNSHFHLLSAFFNLSFLHAPGLYALNGFLSIIFLTYILQSLNNAFLKKHNMNKVVIFILFLGSFFYFFKFFIPSQDAVLSTSIFVFYVFISMLNKVTGEDNIRFDYSFFVIILVSVSAIVLKASVLFIVLIPVYFGVWKQIINKQVTAGIKTICLIMLVLTPWLVRNVILSGYLVYPFPSLDLFNVDWKIPVEKVIAEKNITENFARLVDVQTDAPLSLSYWVPVWIHKTGRIIKLIPFLVGVSFLILSYSRFKLKKTNKNTWILFLIFFGGALFTYYQAPRMRFVYVFAFACIGLSFFTLVKNISKQSIHYFFLLPAVIVGFRIIRDPVYLIRHTDEITFNHFFIPESYPEIKTIAKQTQNMTVYIPEKENQCWDANLFCIDPRFYDERLMFRGKTIEEGFKCMK